jgi:hypothetical protein
MPNKIDKLDGTSAATFAVGANTSTAVKLKNSSGTLLLRNKADTNQADLGLKTVLLYDSAGTRKTTLGMPTGAAGDLTFNLPTTAGSANQVLQTDGAGNTSWVAAGSTAACVTEDTTSLAFGTSSPVTMFTLPANAVVKDVRVVVDTAFDGTPTMSVGVSGTTSKYAGTGDVDLTTAGEYVVSPGLAADGTTNALIATYSAGGATVGAGRVIVAYSIPA